MRAFAVDVQKYFSLLRGKVTSISSGLQTETAMTEMAPRLDVWLANSAPHLKPSQQPPSHIPRQWHEFSSTIQV